MIGIDWHAIFITAAGVFILFIFGVLILIGACLKIAGEISRREEEQEAALDAVPNDVFIEAIRTYEGRQ